MGIALFLTQYAPTRLARPFSYVVGLLAAVPSIVFGLWGILVLAPALQPLYRGLAGATARVPVLSALFDPDRTTGRNFITAGLIVALMITPIITAVTREIFARVPPEETEGALAMSATRFEVFRDAVLPYSRSGITGAVILGLGRAIGETIAVALVVGSSATLTANLLGPGDTMAAVIANEFGEASGTHRAALIGLGLVLFIITVAVNALARVIVARSEREAGAGR